MSRARRVLLPLTLEGEQASMSTPRHGKAAPGMLVHIKGQRLNTIAKRVEVTGVYTSPVAG